MYNWTYNNHYNAYKLNLSNSLEAIIVVSLDDLGAAVFEVVIYDHEADDEIWRGYYHSFGGAKRGAVAAWKRLRCGTIDTPVAEPPASDEEEADGGSIWVREYDGSHDWIEYVNDNCEIGVVVARPEKVGDPIEGEITVTKLVIRHDFDDERDARHTMISLLQKLAAMAA